MRACVFSLATISSMRKCVCVCVHNVCVLRPVQILKLKAVYWTGRSGDMNNSRQCTTDSFSYSYLFRIFFFFYSALLERRQCEHGCVYFIFLPFLLFFLLVMKMGWSWWGSQGVHDNYAVITSSYAHRLNRATIRCLCISCCMFVGSVEITRIHPPTQSNHWKAKFN